MDKLSYIPNSKSILGEGPLYNELENSLYWTDIKDKKIYKYDLKTKETNSYQFNKAIGSFAFTTNNELIATTNDGYEYLNLKNKNTIMINNPEENLPDNRFNDGKCDKNGRYFAGTMDNNEEEIKGSLYCLDGNKIQKKESDLFISNGLGWNSDSTKFYLTDSPKRVIYIYDYDLKTGNLSNKKVFANIKDEDGYPDGLCIDDENHIWSAHWNGWKITRYKPDGSIDATYDLPVPKVTSCNFAGKDLNTLYITTAAFGLSEEELRKAPLSGHTFILETEVKGQKPNLFKKLNTI
ncbi:MAG: SMP-30/gluconolactonase/LRE family protein [Campylobacteraceae bacterium]|nr:SMP-30/gluconolactonase/LRE family protein [Campylobacteraceae bacterium]